MNVWQRMRAWFSYQTLVVELETRADRLAAELRRRDAHHDAEVARLRAENAGLRREAVAVDVANQAVIGQNRRERVFGNQLAHRNRLAVEWAERNLPPEQAAELRGLLAPKLSNPQETRRAR